MPTTDGRKASPASAAGRLLASNLRTGREHALVLLDRLPAQERSGLSGFDEAGEIYGVLRPTNRGQLKVVNHDLALLLLTLREPGLLPAFYRRRSTPAELGQRVALLVADRVLDVEIEGSFLTGAPALAALGLEAGAGGGAIAEKSRLAMRYSAALDGADERELSRHLYRFGCLPLAPRWRWRLPGPEAVLLFLGNPSHPAFERSFPEKDFPWISWHRRGGQYHPGTAFKLYISPKLALLPEVFACLLESLEAGRATSLKVGADAENLLRTDKLVVYFSSFEDLAEQADSLRRRFEGMPVDGVPFSAQIDEEGLLSWGLDPPAPRSSPRSRGSWRSRIVVRIARAILEGRRQQVDDPAEWATIHLGLQGVDAQEWRPRADLLDIAEV